MEALVIGVIALLGIAVAAQFGPKIGVAAPLVMVLLGWLASLPSFVPDVEVDPEWIIAGVLPPLLYASAVAMPPTDFRREFKRISGLSIALVVFTMVVLGFFLHWVLPELPLAWAFALGAILSPTDPVAINIVKKLGISPRVTALLEGESMLNDATALVLLRTAVGAATAATVSAWAVIGDFVFSIAVAGVIGWAVGRITVAIRSRISDVTVTTVVSFTVPFLASVPAELLGASGLVAAVVAGLITGSRAARSFSPQQRLADHWNWRTLSFILEGAVYLLMGIELTAVIHDVESMPDGVGTAARLAAAAFVVALLARAAYAVPLLWGMRGSAKRGERIRPHLAKARTLLNDPDAPAPHASRSRRWQRLEEAREDEQLRAQLNARLSRTEADISYMLAQPLGWRDGAVVVWAGMRGVATIAAAQTLPHETPMRSLLILVAFFVAIGSLALQGGTAALFVRWVKPSTGPSRAESDLERANLDDEVANLVAGLALADDVDPRQARIRVLKAQRRALMRVQELGTYSSAALESKLGEIDAEQIYLEISRA